jgi:hypothetical protein
MYPPPLIGCKEYINWRAEVDFPLEPPKLEAVSFRFMEFLRRREVVAAG